MIRASKPTPAAVRATLAAPLLALALAAQAQPVKPKPPPDEWQGTNFVTAHPASVSGAGDPFDPSIHRPMTPQGAMCSEELNAAIYRQDVLHAFESKAHFDNCAFEESAAYVEALVARSGERIGRIGAAPAGEVPPELRQAMLALGQALHAVQDFYAHSNYVELVQRGSPAPADEASLAIVEFWTPAGREQLRKLTKNGLVSGRVWWSVPAYCSAGAPTHGELAKDSPDTKAGAQPSIFTNKLTGQRIANHAVAYNLASRATREFLRWAGRKWPAIENHCGATVRYIVQPDRRAAD